MNSISSSMPPAAFSAPPPLPSIDSSDATTSSSANADIQSIGDDSIPDNRRGGSTPVVDETGTATSPGVRGAFRRTRGYFRNLSRSGR